MPVCTHHPQQAWANKSWAPGSSPVRKSSHCHWNCRCSASAVCAPRSVLMETQAVVPAARGRGSGFRRNWGENWFCCSGTSPGKQGLVVGHWSAALPCLLMASEPSPPVQEAKTRHVATVGALAALPHGADHSSLVLTDIPGDGAGGSACAHTFLVGYLTGRKQVPPKTHAGPLTGSIHLAKSGLDQGPTSPVAWKVPP